MDEEQQEMPFPIRTRKRAPLELKLRVLSAVDYAPGTTLRARIKHVSERTFPMNKPARPTALPGAPSALGCIATKNTP